MAGGGSPWKLDPKGPAFRALMESLDSIAAADSRDRIVQLVFLELETNPESSRSLREFVEGPLTGAIRSVLDEEAADTVSAALDPFMDAPATRPEPSATSSSRSGRPEQGFREAIPRGEPGRAGPSKSPFLVRRSTRPAAQVSSTPAPKAFREEVADAHPRRLGWHEELPPGRAVVPPDVSEPPGASAGEPPPRHDVAAELRESIRRDLQPGIREEAVTTPSGRAPAPVPAPAVVQPPPPQASAERAEVLIVTADQGVADDMIERLAGRATARWVKDMMTMMRAPEIGSDTPPKVVLDLCSLPMDTRMLVSMAPVIPPNLRIVLWGAPDDLQSSLEGTGWDDTRWTAVDGSSSADEVIWVLG